MKNGIALLTLLCLAGCTTASVAPDKESLCGARPSDEQAQTAAQIFVERSGLKDPSSAQIRDARVGTRSSWYNGMINGGGYTYGWLIDFELNAKNSFGAYIGFQPKEILRTPDGVSHWRYQLE